MNDPIDCGCPDYSVSRRSLLRTAGLATMAGVVTSMVGDVLTSTVYGETDGNVLVVLSLRGGADGLSMVVPHAEAAYARARPTTKVATSTLLHADETFGLHPAFAPLSPWWQGKKLAALHAIGLPAPNRSHFEAMEAVEDADPGSSARVGWINRMISGLSSSPDVLDQLQLGTTTTPTAMIGSAPSLSAVRLDDLAMPLAEDARLLQASSALIRSSYAKAGGMVGAAGIDALDLATRARTIGSAVKNQPSRATYAQYSDAGTALQHAAQLIKAGVGVKAVAIDAGGWDHHVGLSWNVKATIKELATNLAAFFTDLGAAGDRVTVVTLSEFGRRLQENGSAGVDHGYGNCVLAMGAGVRGGQYYARWPGLDAGEQVDGDLAVTTDYRSVLGEILASRFPTVDRSKVFPGVAAAPLGFMA
ncbi:MAG: DUF1501 domain-containing protein [Actinomycetales bacterium]|nr:MAG: DUF1501 domain-containing protein [Actinomycetales bacterium]